MQQGSVLCIYLLMQQSLKHTKKEGKSEMKVQHRMQSKGEACIGMTDSLKIHRACLNYVELKQTGIPA